MSGLYINETSFLQLIDLKWTVIGVRMDVVCTVVLYSRRTSVGSKEIAFEKCSNLYLRLLHYRTR